MRVALLTHNAQAGDAIGNQVAQKLAFFLARGADVRVFTESDRRLHPEVQPYGQVLDPERPEKAGWEFLTSADLIVAEFGQGYRLLGEILPVVAGGKPRIVIDYHGLTPLSWWGSHNREALEQGVLQRGLVWCADTALVHSRFTEHELREGTEFPPERVWRFGYPVNTEFFAEAKSESGRLPSPLARGTKVLLFVGRVAPNKRVPVLVEALGRLRERRPPVHAVVVGDTGDLYEEEARRCRELAEQLGVAERLQFLGRVSEEELRAAYRSADVLVMPSRHEGFCLPVVEAMACGLPVVAARAGALPETVGGAGLTFRPDDAADLARKVEKILDSEEGGQSGQVASPGKKVAVVSLRFGRNFVGGAETSLRNIAATLRDQGYQVEVFATCTREEDSGDQSFPEGTTFQDGLMVQRFRTDPRQAACYQEAYQAIQEAQAEVAEEVAVDFLRHSVRSSRLVEELRRRLGEFEAVIVGPYLTGLTVDVVRECAGKTLLLPCWHDEATARLPLLRETLEDMGGMLLHTPEEKDLAETRLGVNHPGAHCCGYNLEALGKGDPERGRARVGGGSRYVLYVGRYSREKGLPMLLEYAQHYGERHPERFTFVFLGQGSVRIPRASWARDLGFVEEAVKCDVLAGAEVLVQLSANESLSLAALEAWEQGVPVLANARCEVMQGHKRRGGGGWLVKDEEEFAAALDDLWEHPERWQAMGRQGREYVQTRYGSRKAYAEALVRAIEELKVPLAERMRRRGRERAALFTRTAWEEQFGRLVERVLDSPPRAVREQIEVRPRLESCTAPPGPERLLIPVEVQNRGTHPAVSAGPARTVLRCRVMGITGTAATATPLPGLLIPGRSMPAAVPVLVPAQAGVYRVVLWAERSERSRGPEAEMRLVVEAGAVRASGDCVMPFLALVQAALAQAEQVQRLPDGYVDVTEGRWAGLKRWIKRKVLGNFQRAYVDVLSRQQSAFNQRLLAALNELVVCCATLDHGAQGEAREAPPEVAQLRAQIAELEERLGRLERQGAEKVS